MGGPLALADPSAGFRNVRLVRWEGVEPHGLRAAGADYGQDLSGGGVVRSLMLCVHPVVSVDCFRLYICVSYSTCSVTYSMFDNHVPCGL